MRHAPFLRPADPPESHADPVARAALFLQDAPLLRWSMRFSIDTNACLDRATSIGLATNRCAWVVISQWSPQG